VNDDQLKIIPEIKRLCALREYDKAIELSNELMSVSKRIAVEAHLLIMEHEVGYLLKKIKN